jgi:cyclopropane fatty-acyl-phospholipid synthase-like methyltransferase
MPEKEWYKAWFNSPFYHKLYFEHDEEEARKIIVRLLNYFKLPPESRILDVACGRGRHSRFLAAQKFDVTGIDLSFDSIEYAMQTARKESYAENLHFYQHDMRLPMWANYFDLALNFFTSFGYFATRREHDDAIRTIARSLKPDGSLLFDYLNVHYVEEHLIHDEIKILGETKYEIHRWMDEDHFYKKIIVMDPSLDSPKEFTEKVAKLSLGDFTDMLSFQNMQVIEVFGDYELNSYDVKKTPRMIVVGKKSPLSPGGGT